MAAYTAAGLFLFPRYDRLTIFVNNLKKTAKYDTINKMESYLEKELA